MMTNREPNSCVSRWNWTTLMHGEVKSKEKWSTKPKPGSVLLFKYYFDLTLSLILKKYP